MVHWNERDALFDHLIKFIFPTTKIYNPNYDINTVKYCEVFVIFHRHAGKIVNFEIG